ncbi:uncharacterized protein Dwil_GK15467, isoform A [Drosophila willistoni]|uniref:Uncharacterized protein, isoform A n=1 Tax=Drosophila willistoni TaxID=7260 RepID=B4MVC0_DROWI|nr:spleen trypsin inhibitor I isoform X1 [Drosophila willistoni]EDW76465.1 uncharacterized protein Dwil_GK15467, isoform A [Drosophila willistoni]
MSTQFLSLRAIVLLVMILHLSQVQAANNNAKPVAQVPQPTQASQTTKPPKIQVAAKCLQPLDPGPCRMSLERYYYNKDKNACETFKFGGCRGNDNCFGFKQTCEEACLVKK